MFEMCCPVTVCVDDVVVDHLRLSQHVWGLGVDDSEFQRMMLEHLFVDVGIPKSQVHSSCACF